jgi:hypothetical protein
MIRNPIKFIKCLFFISLIASQTKAYGQLIIDSVSLGPNFSNEVFYSLSKGETQANGISDWDFSHTTISRDNCLRLNHVKGWELRQYPKGSIADWSSMDTSNWQSWPIYFNSPQNHLLGAFNRTKNSKNVWDFSWGVYNPNSHEVVGDSLFILVKDGQPIMKFWPMVQKINGDLVFQTQAFDGSPAKRDTLLQSVAGKRHHKYYSFAQGQINVEPLKNEWDLRFTQYADPQWDSTRSVWNSNVVVGVQSSPSLRVKPIENHSWQWALDSFWSYSGPTFFDLNSVGANWKALDSQSQTWSVNSNLSYWLDNDSTQALFHFLNFEGENSGKIVFEFLPLAQTLNLVKPRVCDIAQAFPNPVSDQLFIPLTGIEEAELTLFNSQGQCVARSGKIEPKNGSAPVISMPFQHLPSGRYVLTIAQNGQIHIQNIIKL